MFALLERIKSIIWLHRKCGGIFRGQAIICTSGCYNYASSKSGMGRQRSRLPGTGKATVGAEEVECDEK
jgi:hypothetical protein